MPLFRSNKHGKEKEKTTKPADVSSHPEALSRELENLELQPTQTPILSPVSSTASTTLHLVISLRSVSPLPDPNIANILPLYQMYQVTVQRGLTPVLENYRVDPPIYLDSNEITPVNSSLDLAQMQQQLLSLQASSTTNLSPPPILDEDQEQLNLLWENTLLANAHKLKNFTNSENSFLDSLKVIIQPTVEVCQKGVIPTPMDVKDREFRQGEYLHGYVTIENTLKIPIPFDMVYVVFEGTIECLKPPGLNHSAMADRKIGLVYKFLNMVDLYALWGYANIDRLVTDNGDPHDWCEGDIDTWDGSELSIGVKRIFQPGVKYKRFFTFRIPPKLLDDACDPHDMTWHQEMLPSLGRSNGKVLSSDLRDFGFVDALVAYRLEARVIGKASEYNIPTEKSDEYIIAKDCKVPIRIIPTLDPILNLKENRDEMKLYYRAFLDQVKEKIVLGKELLALNKEESDAARASGGISSSSALTPVSSMDLMKQRQLYPFRSHELDAKLRRKPLEDFYQGIIKYRKRTLTGLGRASGTLLIATPKTFHHIAYRTPKRYVGADELPPSSATTVKVPIVLLFSEVGLLAPEIKDISVEVMCVTIKSPTFPIAVPFTHDQLFEECSIDGSKGNFDSIVVKGMMKKLNELTELLKKNGPDVLLVEQQLFKDMKSIALCTSKYSLIVITNMLLLTWGAQTSAGTYKSVGAVPWTVEKETNDQQKKFILEFDVADAELKQVNGSTKKGEFCLVPDFQLCHMARFYYIKITARTSSAQSLTVNVPLVVENYGDYREGD